MSNYNCLTMMILRKCRANYEELTSLINKMSIDFVIALANALEVSLDELFKDDLTFLLSDTEEDNIAALLKSCKSEEKESLKKILTIIQSDLNFYLDILE